MPYQIYARKTPRIGRPSVSFSKIGQIAFNQHAARLLAKSEVQSVLLMWDADVHCIGIQKNDKTDSRAYMIRYNDKGNGASFSAKTFLDHIGVDYSSRTAIPVDVNPDSEIIVEISLPKNIFADKHALGSVA